MKNDSSYLCCIDCKKTYNTNEPVLKCACGGLLDVRHAFYEDNLQFEPYKGLLAARRAANNAVDRSGVWRFRELIYPGNDTGTLISRNEGNTGIYSHRAVAEYIGSDSLILKHEGENPTGSFKDRGMTVAVTHAAKMGYKKVSCASTGNTAASLAAFSAYAGLDCYVFLPAGQTARGKLMQAVAYGAKTIQIEGDFDAAMRLVLESYEKFGVFPLNSVNPFRIEGQKTIILEALENLGWNIPDWIVFPAGNLGNTAAFGKIIHELHDLKWIGKIPRFAAIQAEGANPFYRSYKDSFTTKHTVTADTLATAIRIGDPVSYKRAIRSLKWTNGIVRDVSDKEIMDAKAVVDRAGIGAEPASCATVAGVKKLIDKKIISPDESILGILTGNLMKDPDAVLNYHEGTLNSIEPKIANRPVTIKPDLQELEKIFI